MWNLPATLVLVVSGTNKQNRDRLIGREQVDSYWGVREWRD